MRSRLTTAFLSALVCVLVLVAPAHATFPGANGKIAFDDGYKIHTINPDGTGETTFAQYGVNPSWSADGSKIAYDSSGYVFVANADGTGERNIHGFASHPAWSPDGRIAYGAERIDCYSEYDCYVVPDGIFVMNSDGSGDHRLTTMGDGERIAWSPDGTKIAFSNASPSSPDYWPDIYVMNADGTGITDVTRTDNGWEQSPSWSPDGTKIAYRLWAATQEIWVSNPDGSGQMRLASGSEDLWNPAWSPDGTKIALHRGYGYGVLAVMDASGAHQTDIGRGFDPDWQPIPNRPPGCSGVAASRPVLTTSNHRLVAITLDGATDPDGDSVTFSVDGVTQDEPVVGQGDHTSPDAVDVGDGELRVRAERNQHGDGRVYRIAFTASDGRGGSCSGTVTVSVPLKQRKPAVDSAPPSYDSLAR